jgi:hypothetical protein
MVVGLGDSVRGAEAPAAKGAQLPAATIVVDLSDQAGFPAETLTQARSLVSRIYQDIGVQVLWSDAASNDGEGRFIVHMMLRTNPPRPRMMGNALGDSRAPAGTAFVYRERVLDVARARHLDVATLLAYAMAHEIGHLLLPAPSHAVSGIMNGDWDGRDFRDMAADSLRFAPAQATAIRARAAASSSVASASVDSAVSDQPSAASTQPSVVSNQLPAMN